MKKINSISMQISNGVNSYLGKGSFEKCALDNQKKILGWLEELIPLQLQIDNLAELGCEGLQKRNYARILTKYFPQQYNQFVSINILLRDSDHIALAMKSYKIKEDQYNILIEEKKLKSPGKHTKYVDFETYDKFTTLYNNEQQKRAIELDQKKETIKVDEIAPTEKIDKIENKKEKVLKQKKDTNWMNILLRGV